MAEARKVRLAHLNENIEHPRFEEAPFEDLLIVEEGAPAQVLARRASEADLIVLGEHKERTLFSLSGTARNLLAACPCPVWVQTEPLRDIETILVAIDMSVHSDLTLQTALKIARRLSARVVVLFAFVPPFYSYFAGGGDLGSTPSYVVEDYRKLAEEELERFVQRLPSNGVEVDAVFVDGKPAKVILEYQEKADLIVMGTHGQTGWVRAVLGSVANKVITQAHRPVLAVPHPGRVYRSNSAAAAAPSQS
jgi:nucleotide-binding universal stress UspA family protein